MLRRNLLKGLTSLIVIPFIPNCTYGDVPHNELLQEKTYWIKFTFNENGQITRFDDSNHYWHQYTYDQYGNQIAFENSRGYKNNFIVKCDKIYTRLPKSPNGYWYISTYDCNGEIIKFEDSNNFWSTYDKNGHLINESNTVKRPEELNFV